MIEVSSVEKSRGDPYYWEILVQSEERGVVVQKKLEACREERYMEKITGGDVVGKRLGLMQGREAKVWMKAGYRTPSAAAFEKPADFADDSRNGEMSDGYLEGERMIQVKGDRVGTEKSVCHIIDQVIRGNKDYGDW